MIGALKAAPEGSPQRTLHKVFETAKRTAEASSLFVRESGRYQLTRPLHDRQVSDSMPEMALGWGDGAA
jgi:hypothetical protein